METNQIIGVSIIGVVVGALTGILVSSVMKYSNRDSTTDRESNFGTIGDSDSSTIPNASFSDRDVDENQFKDEGLTDYSEGVNLPRGGKSKRKSKTKRKTKTKKIKKNKKL
jgi:hypothetical protein